MRCPYCAKGWRLLPQRTAGLRLHLVNCPAAPADAWQQVPMTPDAADEHEGPFQADVMALAASLGWLTCHHRRTRGRDGRWLTNTSAAGYPDLTLVRPPTVAALECKRTTGKATPEQQRWIVAFQRSGAEAAVVTPADWPAIMRLLVTGTARPQ